MKLHFPRPWDKYQPKVFANYEGNSRTPMYQFVKTLIKSNLVHGLSPTFAGQRCATCARRTAMYSADGKARICYSSRVEHVASRFLFKFKSSSSGVWEKISLIYIYIYM